MKDLLPLFILLLVAPVHPAQAPIPLDTASKVEEVFLAGASLRVFISVDKCTVNFPKNLPSYSFGADIQAATLTQSQPWSLKTTFLQSVNGSRFNLNGPVLRLLSIEQMSSDSLTLHVVDTNPASGAPLTSGTGTCQLGSGAVQWHATSDKGTMLEDFNAFKMALTSGYRVTYLLDLGKCSSTGPATNQVWGGNVDNFRFNNGGDLALTKQIDSSTVNTFADIKAQSDGTVSVAVVSFNSQSKGLLLRSDYSCTFRNGFKAFQV